MKQKNRFYLLVGLILALSSGVALVSYAQTAILFDKDINLGGTKKILNVNEIIFSDASSLTSASGIGEGGLASTTPFSAGYIPYATSSNSLTNSVIFQSSSNVGIGTTAPSGLLHVDKNQNTVTFAYITNANTGTAARGGLMFGGSGANGNYGTLEYIGPGYTASGIYQSNRTLLKAGSAATNGLAFGTSEATADITFYPGVGTAEKVRIDQDGNVGIGTTGPGAKLDVSGGHITTDGTYGLKAFGVGSIGDTNYEYLGFDHSGTVGRIFTYAGGTGTIRPLQLSAGSSATNGIYILATGNVGIGTTGPNERLSVSGNLEFQAGNRVVYPKAESSGSGWYLAIKGGEALAGGGGTLDLHGGVGTSANGAIRFYNGNTEGMRLTSGNVGIGTSTPAYKLDVWGTGSFTQPVVVGTPTGNSHATTKSYVDSMFTGSGQWTTNGGLVYLTSTTQSVGIGTTSPNSKLDISNVAENSSYIRLSKYSAPTTYWRINRNDVTTGHFEIGDNFGTKFVITESTGNVGIGTTTPSAKLEVAGTGKILGTGTTGLNVDSSGRITVGNTTATNYVNFMIAATDVYSHMRETDASADEGYWDVRANAGTLSYRTIGDTYTGADDYMVVDRTGVTVDSVTFPSGKVLITDGNVGIGTTGPAGKLHSYGGGDGSAPIIAQNSTYGSVHIGYGNPLATGKVGIVTTDRDLVIAALSTYDLYFGAKTFSDLFIDGATGNVGIGTTGPGQLLHLVSSAQPVLKIENTNAGDEPSVLELYKNTASPAANDSTGALEFYSNDSLGNKTRFGQIRNIINVATNGSEQSETIFRNFVAGTETIVMDIKGGNVGIGTTGPLSKLTLDGTSVNRIQFDVSGVAKGYFGVSDNPAYILGSTVGDIALRSENGLHFGTGGNNERMTILSTGNVGIGTSTPAYKLDVVGTGRFTQPVIVGTPTGDTHAATKSYVDSASSYSPSIYTISSCGGIVAVDWSNGQTQHCTLTGNITSLSFSNGQAGGSYRLIVKQPASGGPYTITWPASIRWGAGGEPTLSTGVSKTDYVGFLYNSIDSKYDGIAFNADF